MDLANFHQSTKICLIAGSGSLPYFVAQSLFDSGFNRIILCMIGSGNKKNKHEYDNRLIDVYGMQYLDYQQFEIGMIGDILDFCRSHEVRHIIACGNIERPVSISDIKTDLDGKQLIAAILKNKIIGDNNLLTAVERFLTKRGFVLLPYKDFLHKPKIFGPITAKKPSDKDLLLCDMGMDFLQHISRYDIGQSIVISDGRIIGVEGFDGTDELISRCSKCGPSSILVKSTKLKQNEKLDLPVVGIGTVEKLIEFGFIGIVITYDVILLDLDWVIKEADIAGLFVYIYPPK